MASVQPRKTGNRGKSGWRRIRWLVQIAFIVFVVGKAAAHQLNQSLAASLDALCPFGAVETAARLTFAGRFLPKLNPSNVVLGLGLLAAILLVGGVFCGWLCPLGTLGDLLTALRRKLGIAEVRVPSTTERWLRWLKFVTLLAVVAATWGLAKLVFADYDPYRTIFSLHWLFSPAEVKLSAWIVTALVLVGSFFIERFWCRYLCPLGALSGLLSKVSFFRLKRTAACTGCRRCDRVCPTHLAVSKGETSLDCVKCLDCVDVCPTGALVIETPGAGDRKRGISGGEPV